ncbi:hypothetical protein [Bradyrhizobium sp. Leo121]|uniref:hypothetical protein n=1 Tax=Bradyrhizobium sp. Leo121 TaxID=1571195 RepID=UPI001029C767|nr:hypothetical protein [Bradyrhizobium sp. Leo121]RZN21118.1 hypothetical protein CWO90_33500 [Bradyrhizobium sp. Leo121]
MPVRKRKDRRKQAAGLDEWETALEAGFDLFGDLADAGVQTDAYGRPDPEDARQAWQRFGMEIMQRPRHPLLGPPWGLTEFGEP